MVWQQLIKPFESTALSVLVASVPILFIFWALIIRRMKGYQASLLATVLAFCIAVAFYKMPVSLAVLSVAHGMLYGLFPICWLVLMAMFVFNLTVKSGQFDVIRHFMASITADRRLQALLIAFSFGSFLEGTAGFGAPVAITAAILVGLGFHPLYASGICLIANTAPVAFGSIGIPITVAAQVSGIPEMPISQMVGRTLPLLSLFLPFYLVSIMAGYKKALEVLPAVGVCGLSFAVLQFVSSNFLGPSLPDVIAGLGSIISLMVLLRVWQPKRVWQFENETAAATTVPIVYTPGQLVRAWSPFLFLTVLVICWGIPSVKEALDNVGKVQFAFPGLHKAIRGLDGNLIPKLFKLNILSAAGTAILLTSLLAIPTLGLTYRQGADVFADTLRQLRFPILTIASVLGFAYVLNDSGITNTLAHVLAGTGALFPFFAPILGWLGVFITGSDTSANALFCKLQATTAQTIGIAPVVPVAANISGGVVGKMISPQSIAVAAAAGNLVGREADLFRFTVKHSFILLLIISLLVLAQAYTLPWLIPTYSPAAATAAASAPPNTQTGWLLLAVVAVALGFVSVWIRRNPNPQNR